MKKSLFIFLTGGAMALFSSCSNTEAYSRNDVNIVNHVVENGQMRLTYQPMMESLYFSPGINLKDNGDATAIEFVKCRINTTCKVDVKGTQNGSSVEVQFPLKSGHKIQISDKTGTVDLDSVLE